MKTLEELTKKTDRDVWKEILDEFQIGDSRSSIVPSDPDRTASEITKLQMTVNSYLGAVVFNTGGMLFRNGFVRLYGSGSNELPSIGDVNGLTDLDNYPGMLVIGYDVIGGVFALDGGALAIDKGSVCYLSVDTLEWESLELPYSSFLSWLIDGTRIEGFYENLLWDSWESDLSKLGTESGFFLYPLPSTTAWRDKKSRTAKEVPLLELGTMYHGMDIYSI